MPGEVEQTPLYAGRLASSLIAVDATWPASIKTVADRYRIDYAAWLKAKVAYEVANPGTTYAEAAPDMTTNYDSQVTRVGGTVSGPYGLTLNTIAGWMLHRLANNEEAVDPIRRPTLHKNEVVAPISNVRASNIDTERVFSYAKLLAVETTLDAATLLRLADLATPFPYWFKDRPKVGTTQQGRFTITQDYIGLADYDAVQWGATITV